MSDIKVLGLVVKGIIEFYVVNNFSWACKVHKRTNLKRILSDCGGDLLSEVEKNRMRN